MRITHPISALLLMPLMWTLVGCKGGELSTPKGAAKTFASALANGDADGAINASTGGDPQIIASMARMAGNLKKMHDAAIARFGDSAEPLFSHPGDDASELSRKLDDATVTEEGDTAVVTTQDGVEPFRLKKVGREWKVDASHLNAAMAGMGSAMFDAMSSTAARTAADILAGKYNTAKEAHDGFKSKMDGASLGEFAPPKP